MPDNAISLNLKPSVSRQLSEMGMLVFWRDGIIPGSRQGLACILSLCPYPECACELVYINGFTIDARTDEIYWDAAGVHAKTPDGLEADDLMSGWTLSAAIDPNSGEIISDPDDPNESDPVLMEWLRSEINGELLDLLYCFRMRSRGRQIEKPKEDIDIDYLEAEHLSPCSALLDCVRDDEFLLDGRIYWVDIYICPDPDCDCHNARVVFFEDADDSGYGVGWAYLDISGPAGLKSIELSAERGAKESLIKELWRLFERRHDAGAFLRRREAQCKLVGETLWAPVPAPIRVTPQPGRNEPCFCGSGRKFKECCLNKSK